MYLPFSTYGWNGRTNARMTLPLVGSSTLLISFNTVSGWSQRSSKFKQLITSYWNPVFCHSFIPSTLQREKEIKNQVQRESPRIKIPNECPDSTERSANQAMRKGRHCLSSLMEKKTTNNRHSYIFSHTFTLPYKYQGIIKVSCPKLKLNILLK